MNAIETIVEHIEDIRAGKAKVHPGQPHRISEAASIGDGVWQGDLGIEIVNDKAPDGYALQKGVKQLVPGTTQGARHCLADPSTAETYFPADWSDQYDELDGPFLRAISDTTIEHPTHGDVTVPAGFCVQLRYQREWDAEQKKERRAAD